MLLCFGSKGKKVGDLQRKLSDLGYYDGKIDNAFGPKTDRAVERFQRDHGLVVDKVVGPKTWAALEAALAEKKNQNAQPAQPATQTYKKGSKGSGVKALQERLIEWGLYPKGMADGIFGKQTENAVLTFQKGMGLQPDRVAGPKTQAALYGPIIQLKHFRTEELICHCQGRYCKGLPQGGIDPALLILLERIRAEAGDKPIIITSGYRCATWNRKEGGALLSQHIYGRAADIKIEGMSVPEANALCDRLNPYGGVGLGGQNITHVDVRGKRSRWRY